MGETRASTHELYREFRSVFNTETETASPRAAVLQIVMAYELPPSMMRSSGDQFGSLLNGLLFECCWHHHPATRNGFSFFRKSVSKSAPKVSPP